MAKQVSIVASTIAAAAAVGPRALLRFDDPTSDLGKELATRRLKLALALNSYSAETFKAYGTLLAEATDRGDAHLAEQITKLVEIYDRNFEGIRAALGAANDTLQDLGRRVAALEAKEP